MTFYNQANIGLSSWFEDANENLYVARGSMFQENEFNGLEIMRFDPLNSGSPFEKLGKFESGISFHCINWSNFNEEYPKGIITGGLKDGSLVLFDASKIIQDNSDENVQNEDAIIASFELYQNEDFYCMEYNPFKSTLLATGGHEIFIVNFEKGHTQPEIIIPQANQSTSDSIITSIAWNKSKFVQHILASAQDNGRINIIDLKLKKNIFSFSDGKEHITRRNVGIAWNPAIATQIAVAFDNVDSGVQIWDLRNNKSPLKKINTGFVQNIHSITWSPISKTTILLANKSGEFVEYNLENDSFEEYRKDGFKTLYSKYTSIKDTFYAVSEEGEMLVHAKNNSHLQNLAMKMCPSSLKSKTQISAGMSGNGLICFKADTDKGVYSYKTPIVNTRDFPNKKALENFEKIVFESAGNLEKLTQKMCKNSKHDKYLINLIAVLDKSTEEKLLVLDIDTDEIMRNTEQITGSSYHQTEKSPKEKTDMTKKLGGIQEDEALDFFADLGKQNDENACDMLENVPANSFLEDPAKDDLVAQNFALNKNWNKGLEGLIKKNILMNNYEGAIDLSLKAHRVFEAFVIALTHPTKKDHLQNYLMSKYVDNENFFSDFLNPLITKNYEAILSGYSIDEWKDMVTFIVKNIPLALDQNLHFSRLIGTLKEKGKNDKVLRYIYFLSGKIDDFIAHLFEESNDQELQLSEIISNFEILYLLKMKLDFSFDHSSYEQYLIRLILILIENEQIHFAYELLSKFGNQKSDRIKYLQSAIFSTFSSNLQSFYYKPQETKKHDFIFPKKQKAKEQPKPVNVKQNSNPFGKEVEPQTRYPQKIDDQSKVEDDKKKVPKPIIGLTKNPIGMVKNPIQNLEKNTPPFDSELTKSNDLPPKNIIKNPKPIPVINQNLYESETTNDQINQSKNVKHSLTQGVNKFSGPPPMPVKLQTSQVQSKQENVPFQEKQEAKSYVPPPKMVGTMQPLVQEKQKTGPPPSSMQKVPLPQQQSILQNYDEKKVKNIVEFVEKTPEVLKLIETNPSKASAMYDCLQLLLKMIKSKSIDVAVFDKFYNIVHFIEENRLSEATITTRELSSVVKGDLMHVWTVLDKIVKYLL